jgi:hypothetical protein
VGHVESSQKITKIPVVKRDVAVSPVGDVGGKPTREHHIRARSQRLERLQFLALVPAQRFDLRFLRPFRADLSIRKSSSFFPPLIAATSQRGLAPRPAQVSPDGPRYFGGTFIPFNALRPPRTILGPPTTAMLVTLYGARPSTFAGDAEAKRSGGNPVPPLRGSLALIPRSDMVSSRSQREW